MLRSAGAENAVHERDAVGAERRELAGRQRSQGAARVALAAGSDARDREMRAERPLLQRESSSGEPLTNACGDFDERRPSRGHAEPEDSRSSSRGKCARPADGELETRNAARCFHARGRSGVEARFRLLSKKRQGEVELVHFAEADPPLVRGANAPEDRA